MNRYQKEVAPIGNTEARLAELRRLASTAQAVERVLVPAFEDPFPPLRHAAALLVAEKMTAERSQALAALLGAATTPLFDVDAENARVRASVCLALDVEGITTAAYEALCTTVVEDPDPTVRYHAIMAMHRNAAIDLDQERGVVVEVLENESDPSVLVIACQIVAFRSYDDLSEAVDQARGKLSGNDAFQAALSLAELAQLGAKIPLSTKSAVTGILLERLSDEVTLAAAARALADLDIQAARYPLRKIIKGWFMHPILKVDAAAALIRLGDESGLDYFEKVLNRKRKDARGYALELSGELRLEPFRGRIENEALEATYHSDTAAISLAKWGDERSIEVLRRVQSTHEDPEVRTLASELLDSIDWT